MRLAKATGVLTSTVSFLFLTGSVFAQSATGSAAFGVGGGGATSSSLPNAGSVGLTYGIFLGGAVIFIFGMIKLISSYRD